MATLQGKLGAGRNISEVTGLFPGLLWLGLAALAAFIACIMPPADESEATILVESQQIPDALAQSTVTTGAAERLSVIRQRMVTRDNLQRVIEDLELFQTGPIWRSARKLNRFDPRLSCSRSGCRLKSCSTEPASDNLSVSRKIASEASWQV